MGDLLVTLTNMLRALGERHRRKPVGRRQKWRESKKQKSWAWLDRNSGSFSWQDLRMAAPLIYLHTRGASHTNDGACEANYRLPQRLMGSVHQKVVEQILTRRLDSNLPVALARLVICTGIGWLATLRTALG